MCRQCPNRTYDCRSTGGCPSGCKDRNVRWQAPVCGAVLSPIPSTHCPPAALRGTAPLGDCRRPAATHKEGQGQAAVLLQPFRHTPAATTTTHNGRRYQGVCETVKQIACCCVCITCLPVVPAMLSLQPRCTLKHRQAATRGGECAAPLTSMAPASACSCPTRPCTSSWQLLQ